MSTRRLSVALVAVVALGAVAAAAPARADELYATVDRTAAPGERALVHVRSDTPGPVTLRAYRVEASPGVVATQLDLEDGAGLSLVGEPPVLALTRPATDASGRPVYDGPHDGPGARLTFVVQATATLRVAPLPGPAPSDAPPALPEATVEVALPAAGLYVIRVAHGEQTTVVAALVSRLALVTKRDPGGLLAFCVDRTTGQAVEGAHVAVHQANGGASAEGTTDAKGLVRLVATIAPTAIVVASSGDHWAYGADTYVPADVADRRVHVAVNQPAYRPGERVEVRGIVRTWRDGAYGLDADLRDVAVRFVAAGGRDLARIPAAVSADLGTFATGFTLPADAPTGDARVVVECGEKAYDAPFRIEAYRKPTFELAVTPSPARVLAGGDLTFAVAGTLFEGGPLAGAPFTWTLTYQRLDRDLFPTDELARLFFGTEREALAPETLAQGGGTLDAQGRATVAAKAPAKADDGFVVLRVVATGPDRTTATGSGGAALSAAPLAVAIQADRHLYGAEGTAHVTVRAVLADGRPAASRAAVVSVSLVGEAAGGPRVVEERIVATLPLATGADGTATVDVPFAENGRYALAVAVPRIDGEPTGPPAHAVVHVWVVGDRADVGFSGDRLEIVADKDRYAVGDVARLLVLAPVGARPFLSTVEGARLLAFDTVALPGAEDRGTAAIVTLPITSAHVPNAYVGVALVDHGNLLAMTKLLRVPPVDRLLTPTVLAAKTELDPGETVALTAKVVDAAGAPVVGAEVAIAIVDDALYALYADPFAPLAPFFHPVRRDDVRTGGPLHATSIGWSVRAALEKKLADAGARMPALPAPTEAPRPDPRTGGPPAAAAPAAPPAGPPRDAADGGEFAPGVRNIARLREAEESLDHASQRLKDGAGGGEGPLEARADFRTSIFWAPTLRTGADGTVAVGPVTMGASITRWRVSAHAVDASTRVGSSTTMVRTTKKVVTRVTLPRFLRAGDRVDAPWVLHSLLPADAEARYVAGATGLEIHGPREGREVLRAGAVVAHDLALVAPRVGEGKVTAELRTPAGGDAVEAIVPILPQGVPKVVVAAATTERGEITLPPLALPATAEPGTARLTISVVPSVAQAIGAALPYLADYPYGCTEQTMSRLVPVVVAKAARDRFHAPLAGRLAELPAMLDRGLARLRALQHPDGGFGWWEADASDLAMTAYVVHGLTRAVVVMDDPSAAQAILARATTWLSAAVAAGTSNDAYEPAGAFARMALADAGVDLPARLLVDAPPDRLRGGVSPLAAAFSLRAMLAAKAAPARAAAWLDVLEETVVRDARGVRWQPVSGGDGRWAGDPVETTAWVAGALLAYDPTHRDLAGAVRYLVGARQGADHWQSTRDTAACVAFLTRYAVATNDLGVDRRVELALNGMRLAPVVVSAANAFDGVGRLTLSADAIPQGPITLTATSQGPVAVSIALAFTDTGPAIAAADAGFAVRRTWWLLETKDVAGKPVLVRRPVTETVPSGALLDVDVTVTSATGRDLVMVTSPFVAGFEPEKDYGTPYATPAPAATPVDHVETHDDRVVFFVKALGGGTHVLRHRVRAVHVGAFTSLPASAELMYFPTVRGNGAGEAFEVSRAGPAGAAPEGK